LVEYPLINYVFAESPGLISAGCNIKKGSEKLRQAGEEAAPYFGVNEPKRYTVKKAFLF
jgi:hypothetical protein